MADTDAAAKKSKGGYLEALLNSCPSAIIAINAQGSITFVNKETCNLITCDMNSIIGDSIANIYETEELARETNRKLYMSGGIIHDHESRIKTRKGKIVPVRISAAHLKDSAGNYAGAVGYFEKYRPWHKAEADLKAYADDLEAKLSEWQDLGAPVFELYPGLTVGIIVGRVNTARFERINTILLDYVKGVKSKVVLIDLGSALIDDCVAPKLVHTFRTLQLLGAQCVLSDVQSSVAQEMETLIPDLNLVKSFSNTSSALEAALDILGYSITKKA
ncbi:MAG: PAS domain S-box protein [Chloroflexota bacterium]